MTFFNGLQADEVGATCNATDNFLQRPGVPSNLDILQKMAPWPR